MNAPHDPSSVGQVFAQKAHFDAPIGLRGGAELPSYDIAYETYGTLNAAGPRSRAGRAPPPASPGLRHAPAAPAAAPPPRGVLGGPAQNPPPRGGGPGVQ